jgi:hypothetical protein
MDFLFAEIEKALQNNLFYAALRDGADTSRYLRGTGKRRRPDQRREIQGMA